MFLIKFYWSTVALQCCVVSAAQQSESVMFKHVSLSLRFPPYLRHHIALNSIP